jgi:hypothetical protein
MTRDLLHTELGLARRWFGSQLTCAYWIKDETEALADHAPGLRRTRAWRRPLVADARTARRRIENVAAHMGIQLTGRDTVLLRARSAVNYIEQKIDEAQAAGQLSWFNQAYRAWRLQANSTGAR